ncbi:MAG TPA: tryptophan--tRNA ligase, partial [Candidatus Kapabacteria bacterium]|nr:tryptophan--tRNA ligase [Candidatus Kapabacteria bacterium]
VPVGEDQLPHVEITRELARRFNSQYGEVFPEPEPKLTVFSRLPGLDRNKMSKSLNNTILMSDEPDAVKQKLRGAITDELKVRKNDPGRPEVCLIFTYHKKFNPAEVPEIEANCRSGALGCADCKAKCGAKINEHLAPIIERRKKIESQPSLVSDVLADGEKRARAVAEATMQDVRNVMQMG